MKDNIYPGVFRLRCPICKSNIRYSLKDGYYAIITCGKHQFPFVDGIFYFKKDRLSNNAIKSIVKGNKMEAKICLLNLRLRLLFPVIFLLDKKINISFSTFIRVMKIFGYDKNWCEYLLNRKVNKSYKTTRNICGVLRDGYPVLDFGSGVGQILPIISRVIGPENLYGTDSSFLSLMIARKFFANPSTLLICSDGNSNLPFISNSFRHIIATDSFHYLTNKGGFLNECWQILKKPGSLSIIQTINSPGVVFKNIKGVTPRKMHQLLKQRHFRKVSILSDEQILNRKYLNLYKSPINNRVKDKEPYSTFAFK